MPPPQRPDTAHLWVLKGPGVQAQSSTPGLGGSELWACASPTSQLGQTDALQVGPQSVRVRRKNPTQTSTAMPGRLGDSLRFRLINRFFSRGKGRCHRAHGPPRTGLQGCTPPPQPSEQVRGAPITGEGPTSPKKRRGTGERN